MSTKEEQHHMEDFENAPVGATATHETGSRAIKISSGDQRWLTRRGDYLSSEHILSNEDMEGFTLDPLAPTTAREALDLAWELAHEVKPGQIIPQGTRFIQGFSSGLGEYTAECDFEITPAYVSDIRTLDPLPDPDPDWLDAPAVLASHPLAEQIGLWIPAGDEDMWEWTHGELEAHWSELENVVPLYPRQDA